MVNRSPIGTSLALALGCALSLASHPATAQGSRLSPSARADLLFQQGQELLNAGQVEAACTQFAASETVLNRARTLLLLGECHQRAGRAASAWRALLEAEAVAHEQRDGAREQLAAERVAALEPTLTRIVLTVPMTSRVPGLTVRLGSNPVPPTDWGAPIPVDAGVLRVSAAAEGYDAWSADVDVSRGQGRQYRITVPTLAPVPNAPRTAPHGRAYRTAGVVTGSFGLAGIGAGAVFSAVSRSASDASTCAKGVVQCGSSGSPSVFSDASAVSFALGGALLATGVTLIVLAPDPAKKERNSLRVAARYASGGGRLQLEGAW